jgi:hypothetical protein
VQPVLVQSDKKAEVVLSDGRFATVYKVKLGHVFYSQDENVIIRSVKLIVSIVKIDDKQPTIEEVFNLNIEDFYLILHTINK